jgi:DNA-binding IclR family transcriptional regulator
MRDAKRYEIKVLVKALRILDLFDEKGKELSGTEISEILGMNKASVFRILTNLENAEYLEKDGDTSKYTLGLKLYNLGKLAEPHAKLKKIARPYLEKMNHRCGETVHLAVLHQGEALYLDKIEGTKTIRVISRVGSRLPAHCSGVGKVLLAGLAEEKLDQIVKEKGLKRFTGNTITDLPRLKREIAKFQELGYAIDDEEIEEGLKCAAAPLRDSKGDVLAAISVSVPKERFDKEGPRFISEVIKTGKDISEAFRKARLNGDISRA